MFARKLKTLMAAVAFGLIGLGFVLADDPKPNPPSPVAKAPDPRVLPVRAPLAPIQPAQALKPGEQQVMIEALCVQVSEGFCEESGLTVDNPMPKTGDLLTFLSRREMKMLEALLHAYPGRRIYAEPRLVMRDGQTSSIQTPGPVEEVASLVPTITTDGKTVYTPQTLSLISSHLTLKVTPKISKDNGMIELRVDRETANLGANVTLGSNTIVPSVNVFTQETKAVLPDGGSVAIVNTIASTRGKTKKTETLWVLTAHVVKGKP